MGLDISAYQHIDFAKARPAEPDDSDFDDYLSINNDDVFGDRLDGLAAGFYTTSGDSAGFCAGSYTRYNRWREALAEMVGTTPAEVWRERTSPTVQATPFFELIDFSDCEGTIGPKTSAKLAADFDTWAARAETFAVAKLGAEYGPYWFGMYQQWAKAFRLASVDGAVDFH